MIENTKIKRLRISSLWPEFIDDKCLEVFKNTRIYPHFHFSIQSGSSKILKSMHRHYDSVYMRKLLDKVRKIKRDDWVDISIWADIIVWFPWETEDDFLETYSLVKDYKISKLHAFPFSAHDMWESVPAWKYRDQVDGVIKKDRMKRLLKLGEDIREDFIASQKWKKLQVLIEVVKVSLLEGQIKWKWWSENYIECNQNNFNIESWNIEKNTIVEGSLL
jgi:tRNA A37 methylthiotransferase MiaB